MGTHCVETSALRQRLLGKIVELPHWHDVEAIERVCDVIVEAVIAEIPLPDCVDITPSVAVYDDGEALVVLVAGAEGDGGRPVVLGRRWLYFREQGIEEVVGEVEGMRGEEGRSLRGIG